MEKGITIPEPGIYHGLAAKDYFNWNCFHKSNVAATMKSAKHLKFAMENSKKSGAMVIGSLVDALLLEPAEIDNFPVLPETYINAKDKEMPFNMNSKSCKQMVQDYLDCGLTPIKKPQMDEALAIKMGVLHNPAAKKLLNDAKTQVAIVWDDPETGVRCKARIDAQQPGALIDLKTTRSAVNRTFSRDIVNFGYHTQAAMYLDGWAALNGGEEIDWNFICVENEPPFCCAVYHLDPEAVMAGRIRYKIALKKYKGYLESDPDFLKGYSDYIEPITVPSWEIETSFKDGSEEDVGI
jgi:hypothetical protein